MDNLIVCPWCSTELSATRPSWVSHHADGTHTVTEQACPSVRPEEA